MKWLADLLAALVAVPTFLAVVLTANSRAAAFYGLVFVVSVVFLCRRIHQGLDQIDLVTKRRR